MTIEQKGPGGIGASYGKRFTNRKFDTAKKYDQDVFADSEGKLVGPDGKYLSTGTNNLAQGLQYKALQSTNPWGAPLLPTGTSTINAFASSGASGDVISVDNTVTFGGRPTTKVTFGGTPTGSAFEVGVSGASMTFFGLSKEVLTNYIAVAVKGTAPVTGAKVYIGDPSYANYYEINLTADAINAVVDIGDGWRFIIADCTRSGVVATTGTPDLVGAKAGKVTCFSDLTVTAGTLWLGYVGVIKKQKANVILTFDDGYAEWESYLIPALKARNLPASLSIDSGYIDKPGFMTRSQLKSQVDKRGDLIEFVNHGANNLAYSVGVSDKYKDSIRSCDAFLAELGVPESSRNLHVYVQGQYDAALIQWLKEQGFKGAREVGGSDRTQYAVATSIAKSDTSNQSRYLFPASCNIDVSQPFNTVVGYIENAKAYSKTFTLMGHEFKAAAGPQTWVAGYHATHGFSNLLDYIASERDLGRINVIKWSDYIRQLDEGANFGPFYA